MFKIILNNFFSENILKIMIWNSYLKPLSDEQKMIIKTDFGIRLPNKCLHTKKPTNKSS